MTNYKKKEKQFIKIVIVQAIIHTIIQSLFISMGLVEMLLRSIGVFRGHRFFRTSGVFMMNFEISFGGIYYLIIDRNIHEVFEFFNLF